MKDISIANIADGVSAEYFAREAKKVAENILDPNTKPTATRKIVMTYYFVPDEDREEVRCVVEAKSSMAATRPHGKVIYTGSRNGKPVLLEADPKQTELFDDNVATIGKGGAK